MKYKKQGIRDMGLQPFLGSIGVDYIYFKNLYNSGFSSYQIGKAFINRNTGKHYSSGAAQEWMTVYEEEHGILPSSN